MTTSQTSLDDHTAAIRRPELEQLLAGHLEQVWRFAGGEPEPVPGDFDAALQAVRYLASEIRWLTLGTQTVPF